MNSLRGRILASFGIFLVLFALATVYSYKSLENVAAIRRLQATVVSAQTATLSLVNKDLLLRTYETIKPEFYANHTYPVSKERQILYDSIRKTLAEILSDEIAYDLRIVQEISKVKLDLNRYDSIHQAIMGLQRLRGFKDEGKEGRMRDFIHELEGYDDIIPLAQLLSLRRHEKDYFLRDDTSYVRKLLELSTGINQSLVNSDSRTQQAKELLVSYTDSFKDVVQLERQIGNNNRGLVLRINTMQEAISGDFNLLGREVSLRATKLVNNRVNTYTFLIIGCFVVSTLFGVFMANITSKSIGLLAMSMRKALVSNDFKVDYEKPKHPTWETSTLYNAYDRLLETVHQQMHALEESNSLLGEKNQTLLDMNKELAKSEFALKESNEVKEKFLSIIGHDLKGPMATMMMMINLLVEDIHNFSQNETKQFANNILKSANRISLLLENLLAWSRSQFDKLDPKRELVSVAEVVEDNKNLYEAKLREKEIALNISILGEPLVAVDKNMFDFVLRNLLDNAIKFTHQGGTIYISASEKGDEVRIEVEDSGVGMDQEHLDNLFKSLLSKQQVGTSGEKGTGLGLILCKEFIERNGGSLTVTSELGKGSAFIISMPAKSGEDKPETPANATVRT